MILLTVSFSFLIIVQFLNYNNNDISVNTSWFNQDYTSFLDSQQKLDKGVIILKNLNPNYNNVEVLINGEYVADFSEEDEVKIYVYHNDIVEIDGTKYNNKVSIKVSGISKNIERPMLDEVVTTSQSIEILCKVQLK